MFTYIGDITFGGHRRPGPTTDTQGRGSASCDLGSHKSEELLTFIELIERACGKTAKKQLMPIQPCDVRSTCADIAIADRDLADEPFTFVEESIPRFMKLYAGYHGSTP